MKINSRVRVIYNQALERYEYLRGEVRETLQSRVDDRKWFFIDRVKEQESFALKVETGSVPDPTGLEDFYACTIVVHNAGQIADATDLVTEHFDLRYRRPAADNQTRLRSSEFQFDDLRMFVARRPHERGLREDLNGIVFEVQIKTVLMHAWSLATHDLTYKTDAVSWPKERIAYQVKAMLEHAELAIAEADRLSLAIGRQDERTENVLRVMNQIEDIWSPEKLPSDRKRLAETILRLLQAMRAPVDQLTVIVNEEIRRFGILPQDLSPYAFVVQALAQSHEYDLQQGLERNTRLKVVVHDGMELPAWIKGGHDQIINLAHLTTA